MALIQFGGLASGLDTKSIITALMDVERQPLLRLQTEATAIGDRKTAYGTLRTALTDLLTKIQAFTVSSAGSAHTATSSDAARFTAAAGSAAIPAQYRVSVDRLASATRATSTGALGTAITDATAAGTMSSLPLPGTVRAGQVGLVVDGQILSVAVGDPASTSLQSVIDGIAAAIQAQVQASDPAATVSASIVDNQLRFTVAGAAANHDILMGGAADTSNALAMFGVAGQRIADFGLGSTTITGTTRLGVTRAAGPLDLAGLAGLTSTPTGILTINGVAIAYDSTVDSLNTVLTRINNAQAGVVASVDRANDTIIISAKSAGPSPISIVDTSGTLGAALKLAPGTTNAQVIGQGAQVTVDGRVVTSVTNTVTNAIDGVTLTLLDLSTTTATLTVGVDSSAVQKALTDLVSSYNALADTIEQGRRQRAGGDDRSAPGRPDGQGPCARPALPVHDPRRRALRLARLAERPRRQLGRRRLQGQGPRRGSRSTRRSWRRPWRAIPPGSPISSARRAGSWDPSRTGSSCSRRPTDSSMQARRAPTPSSGRTPTPRSGDRTGSTCGRPRSTGSSPPSRPPCPGSRASNRSSPSR